jgi:hypothetical protein
MAAAPVMLLPPISACGPDQCPVTPRSALTFVLTLLLLVCTSASAATCESLRLQIEAKIKAAGVPQFSLATVEASASAPGKVVGTCDQGNRKIMYERLTPSSPDAESDAESAKPTAAAKRGSDGIITECKDGTVTTSGNCKK